MSERAQIAPGANDSFGKEKTGRKFLIVAGRPHRDRERILGNAYLERLLDCHFVGHVFKTASGLTTDDTAGANSVLLRFRRAHTRIIARKENAARVKGS